MSDLILYHGSTGIIEKPIFGFGKTYNDYGQGFYCTESQDLAKEWATSDGKSGYANRYTLETSGLRMLDLGEYTMLHWLSILAVNRRIASSTPLMEHAMAYLVGNFLLDTQGFDLIKGYRADDSYFSFARAFLSNQISYLQLSQAMRLGRLGEQIMLKSRKAFDLIRFESYEEADFHQYYPSRKKRDEKARAEYRRILETDDMDGLFIRDIMREQIKSDDIRLQ